jgi:hypothetical protein
MAADCIETGNSRIAAEWPNSTGLPNKIPRACIDIGGYLLEYGNQRRIPPKYLDLLELLKETAPGSFLPRPDGLRIGSNAQMVTPFVHCLALN